MTQMIKIWDKQIKKEDGATAESNSTELLEMLSKSN